MHEPVLKLVLPLWNSLESLLRVGGVLPGDPGLGEHLAGDADPGTGVGRQVDPRDLQFPAESPLVKFGGIRVKSWTTPTVLNPN